MATISTFEDLEVYQLSRELNTKLHFIFQKHNSTEFGYLINHIYKTAGSVMDNIAEGFEREGNKEFIQFLAIAKGSSGELRSQITRAFDFEIISNERFQDLSDKCSLISRKLHTFISYLKKSNFTGKKYK